MTSSSESSSQTSLELTLGTVLSLRIGKTDGYAHKRTVREASEAFNTISSFRNAVFDTSESCCIKKEREQKMSSHVEEEEGDCPKKKLRLSKEQSAVLEKCFEGQSTLSTQQKIGLAKELNLKTRQVEVWFQNRRARTKLKQIEEGYELLKKCCQNLREENRRLQEELEEIKALKIPLHMQLPATILTMCHACDHGEEEPVS